MDLSDVRRDYTGERLLEESAPIDPWVLFGDWMTRAVQLPAVEPTAMTLATADVDGIPSARTVLLKRWTEAGLVFFTRYTTAKAADLAQNDRAAVLLYWRELHRQVQARGRVSRLGRSASEDYFRSRPLGSRLAARAASGLRGPVSAGILQQRFEQELATWQADAAGPPMPEDWGGYCLDVQAWEFWQGQPNRLHDRLAYRRRGLAWERWRLAP